MFTMHTSLSRSPKFLAKQIISRDHSIQYYSIRTNDNVFKYEIETASNSLRQSQGHWEPKRREHLIRCRSCFPNLRGCRAWNLPKRFQLPNGQSPLIIQENELLGAVVFYGKMASLHLPKMECSWLIEPTRKINRTYSQSLWDADRSKLYLEKREKSQMLLPRNRTGKVLSENYPSPVPFRIYWTIIQENGYLWIYSDYS